MSMYGGGGGPGSGIPSIVTPSSAGAAPPSAAASPPLGDSSSASSNSEQQIRLQILASLFPPNSPNGSYIAHLKTWEDVPGAPSAGAESKKPRYVLLAVTADGRCKIHKSKRNTNGTFSIGKTWNLEDLRALEVHKPRRSAGPNSFAVTCFTITINAKAYLWETESVRQQDDFLVTLVRSYRQYLNGQEPQLIGFQVGEIPGAAPAYTVPGQGNALPPSGSFSQQGSLASPPRAPAGSSRPGTAASLRSNEGSQYAGQTPGEYGMAMSASNSGTGLGFAQAVAAGGVRPSVSSSTGSFADHAAAHPRSRQQVSPSTSMQHTQSFAQAIDTVSQREREREAIPPPPTASSQQSQSAMRKKPSSTSLREAATISPSSTSRPPLPIPPHNIDQQAPRSASPTKPSRSATPTGPAPAFLSNTKPESRRPSARSLLDPQSSSRAAPGSSTTAGVTIDEAQAAANAAALLGQPSSAVPDDSDIMLTNVEEMLEGLQWGTARSGTAGGGVDGADQIEKRLLGELNALEAAGIHAIIESDDRVIDVVRYLDSALLELDKMDQMLSLYKTHLHAVNDDMAYIEGQNKGLQIQSTNQRALLAELDKRLGSK